ncbi:hypothetical protein HYH03_010342 [Edaphochlamys debaryana]|uniref:Uncharacterized protein n=1 Tax=Edaphochlamys debaryana TaxID=47281 RepID=A0A836BXL0_9CHLO|nr:hypothetical protein HYH03_010342 [Edaphochlamys debaryana]|eukprot:KAG2491338.1 hypothetical protein HYH03_010342 [Edaphochlamys debaryana]
MARPPASRPRRPALTALLAAAVLAIVALTSLIVGGIKGAACAKHTTYEGSSSIVHATGLPLVVSPVLPADYCCVQACTADVENVCFADFPDGRCLSMAGDQIYAREVLCKGSLQQRSDICRNKLMLACGAGADGEEPDADGCVRAEQLWYGGKEAYESLKAETEEGIGGRFVGPAACVLESELAATIDDAGELDYDARKEWEKEYYGDAEKGEADILRARGTCEYAQNSLARAKYQNACSSINNAQLSAMADEPMFKGLNQSDTAAMYDCVSKGCAMPVWNGTHILETFTFEADGYLPDFFVSCAPDGPVVWSTRLNQRTDGLMYKVQQACLAQNLQRNQAMCEAVRVF